MDPSQKNILRSDKYIKISWDIYSNYSAKSKGQISPNGKGGGPVDATVVAATFLMEGNTKLRDYENKHVNFFPIQTHGGPECPDFTESERIDQASSLRDSPRVLLGLR